MANTFTAFNGHTYNIQKAITGHLYCTLHRAMHEITTSTSECDQDVDLIIDIVDGVVYVLPLRGVSLWYPMNAKAEKSLHMLQLFSDCTCKISGDEEDISKLKLTVVPDSIIYSKVHFEVRPNEKMTMETFLEEFWKLVKFDCRFRAAAEPIDHSYNWDFDTTLIGKQNGFLVAALASLGQVVDQRSHTAAMCWFLCRHITSLPLFSFKDLYDSKPARILAMALEHYNPRSVIGEMMVDNAKLYFMRQLRGYEPSLSGALEPLVISSSDDDCPPSSRKKCREGNVTSKVKNTSSRMC